MITTEDTTTISMIVGETVKQIQAAQLSHIESNAITLSDFFRRYMDTHIIVHTRSAKDFERDYRLYLSCWGDKKLIHIRRKDVIELQSDLFKLKGKSTANRAVELLSMIYNKAIEWEMVVSNPAARIKKFKLQPRERFLLPEELPRFITAVKTLRNQTSSDYFMMLLFTAQRRRNVCEMRWEDIDFVRGVWRIPQTKNGTSHNVPLVEEAVKILERRKTDESRHEIWVFPKQDGSGPIWSLDIAWKSILERAQLKDLRIHDLRRSHASWQAITGVNTAIIGATLNHKDPKSTMIYARLYIDPVRDAMQQSVDAMLNTGEPIPESQPCGYSEKRAVLRIVKVQANGTGSRSNLPRNAAVKISPEQQLGLEAKILAAAQSGPNTKGKIHKMIGGFHLNGFELDRILQEMVDRKLLCRIRKPPHWTCWQYVLPKEEIEQSLVL